MGGGGGVRERPVPLDWPLRMLRSAMDGTGLPAPPFMLPLDRPPPSMRYGCAFAFCDVEKKRFILLDMMAGM